MSKTDFIWGNLQKEYSGWDCHYPYIDRHKWFGFGDRKPHDDEVAVDKDLQNQQRNYKSVT